MSYGFPSIGSVKSVYNGCKIFPEFDGKAQPVGMVEKIRREGNDIIFILSDGRELTYKSDESIFYACKM